MSITLTTDTAIERIRKIYPECGNITITETFKPGRGWMQVLEEGGYGIKQIAWLRETGVTAVQLRLIDRHNAVRFPDFQMFEFEVESNFEVSMTLSVHVNQGEREALVVAVLEKEALIEYEMPAGTSSLLLIKRNAYPKVEIIRNISYNLPRKWIAAIYEGRLGLHNLIWNPQAGKHSAQKSFERAEKIAQEIETLEKETVK